MIERLIHVIKLNQAELSMSLASGHAQSWEAYQRLVGRYEGFQQVLDEIDNLLDEDKGKE
jgi:hypothetical protein